MTDRNLESRLKVAKHMIELLGDHTIKRSDWNILCKITGTKFQRMLKFLIQHEYVERVGRGIYRATEKGKAFAKSI